MRVDSLLKDPHDTDASPRIDLLWTKALDGLLAEIQQVVGQLPASFVTRLHNPADGWRAVARLLFAETYKNETKVFRVLVVELLGDVRDRIGELQQQAAKDHSALVELSREQHDAIAAQLHLQCGELGNQLTEALNQLRADLDTRPAHAELRLRVGDVQARLDELLQRNRQSSQQFARQDRILRMLLMTAMREEAARRGQPIDGRFGISAEDVSAIIRDKSALLIGRRAALADLDNWQAKHLMGVRYVSAAAGVGKSSLLASWLLEREVLGNRVVRHFFSRNFPETVGTESALEHLLRQLRCQMGHRAEPACDDRKSVKDRIHGLLKQSVEGPPLIVVRSRPTAPIDARSSRIC